MSEQGNDSENEIADALELNKPTQMERKVEFNDENNSDEDKVEDDDEGEDRWGRFRSRVNGPQPSKASANEELSRQARQEGLPMPLIRVTGRQNNTSSPEVKAKSPWAKAKGPFVSWRPLFQLRGIQTQI